MGRKICRSIRIFIKSIVFFKLFCYNIKWNDEKGFTRLGGDLKLSFIKSGGFYEENRLTDQRR